MKTLIRATKAIDQEAMSSPYQDATYIPIENLQRWTGLGVSPETAMNVITIYQCVRILAQTFASVPLLLYRRLPDGGKERATDHPLYDTFHLRPNPDMSSYVWRELVMSHLKTWGNHYSEKVYNYSNRLELWPIRPDRIEAKYESGVRVYDYLSPTGGRKRMKPGSVFHVQGLSSNGLVGMSPIAVMRTTIALLRTAERYGQGVFDNGARPAVILSHPKNLSDPAISRLAAQFDDMKGARNSGRTLVAEEGLTVNEVGFPPEDAQFMETRLFQKRDLAAGYGVPSEMVGDPEGDDKEAETSLKLIKRTMLPEFVNFEQAAQIQIIDEPDLYLEFLADGYLRGDPKARADAYAVQWEHGALNADEWRRYENQNPLPDELGKTYFRPANWVPVGEDPVAVGGDASRDTQFGQEAALVDQMTRAKGGWPAIDSAKMSRFDCPDCGKLIARMAAPGTIGFCKSCKAERTMEAEPIEAVA